MYILKANGNYNIIDVKKSLGNFYVFWQSDGETLSYISLY